MNSNEIRYQIGIPEQHRVDAAHLYDEAFGKKFSLAIKNKDKRIQILADGFQLHNGIGAFNQNELVGLAGFKSANGSLTGDITYQSLLSHLGFFKGNWAALVFSLYERASIKGELLMDGISVHSGSRGLGIGSALLSELKKFASSNGYTHIRLDVIDTNPKAQKLYARRGFEVVKSEDFSCLKWLIGFGGVTTMHFKVNGKLNGEVYVE